MTTRPLVRFMPLPLAIAIATAVVGQAACSGSDASNAAGTNGSDGGNTSGDGGTSGGDGGSSGDGGTTSGDGSTTGARPIFVIPMENKAQTAIYGDTTDAPYINDTLLKAYPHTTNFNDELPSLMSEPHYIFMESGTNVFSDHTFNTDGDSTPKNSTNSVDHLSAQLTAAGISWTSYQQGMTEGTCPVASVTGNFFAAKHDPFVFFQDVVGADASAGNPDCIAHHKPIEKLVSDLAAGTVSTYNYVTPDLCHDMHGDSNCPQGASDAPNIAAGDKWLHDNLQPIIDYALAHDGFVFITWDEGDSSNLIPFIAIGKNSIAKHVGTVMYTHASLLKSEEEILGVPVLAKVSSANDFSDLFTSFP